MAAISESEEDIADSKDCEDALDGIESIDTQLLVLAVAKSSFERSGRLSEDC